MPALVPNMRFPEFRDGPKWPQQALGGIAVILKGKGISKADLDPNGTQACIRYGELYTRYGETITVVVSRTKVPASELFLSKADDVIIPSSGETKIDIAKASCVLEGGIALGGDLNIIRSKLNGTFLSYYLNGPKRRDIAKVAQGDTVVHLYPHQLEALHIAVPSPAEQQKIAECLSSVDELIAAQARKVDALKTHKKGLMQQLFPREGETQPRLRFPEFQNAGEWDFKPFEEFVTKSFYGTSSSTAPTGKYPVLRMGNMVDGGLDFTNLVYLDLDPDSFESFRLEDGDILLNRTNSPALVGKISLFRLKSECMTASYIVTYRLNKKRIDPSFCNSMLNTPLYQARIRSFAKPSVSQVNINPTTFKKDLIVSVPSLAEQQRIATCLSNLDDRITAETQKLEALKTHKKGLMQQLFPATEEMVT